MTYLYSFVAAISLTTFVTAAIPAVEATLPKINLYALDADGAEAPAGAPNPASFRVTHDFPPTATVKFLFALGGSAREGADYLVSAATPIETNFFGRWFTFPTGQNTAEIVITPVDDGFVENDETVTLSLYTPPFIGFSEGTSRPTLEEWRATFGFAHGNNATATVSIRSDDNFPTSVALVTLAATDSVGSETAPTAGAKDPAIFTLARSGPNLPVMTVNYSLVPLPKGIPPTAPVPVMARNGVDFETLTGSVTFAEGANTAEIVVQPIFDVEVEAEEYIQIALQPASAPGSYVLEEQATAVARILNFTPPNIPIVSLAVNDPQAIEDDVTRRTGSFLISRQGNTDTALTIPYQIGGTALNGIDYVALSGRVTLPAGSSGALIAITPINDNLPEGVESVGLTLLSPPTDVYPPPYVVGHARSAGVAIRDHLRSSPIFPGTSPHLATLIRMPAGAILLSDPIPNTAGITFLIEASTDLVNWEELGPASITEGVAQFTDVNASSLPARFYRLHAVKASAP